MTRSVKLPGVNEKLSWKSSFGDEKLITWTSPDISCAGMSSHETDHPDISLPVGATIFSEKAPEAIPEFAIKLVGAFGVMRTA